jgi:integrase/recombinase XerD
MATRSRKSLQRDALTAQIIMRVWRADRSITANSAQQYLQWIGQFRCYCRERGLVEVDELTRDGAKRFKAWYARSRKVKVANLGLASSSMRALRRVYEVMGAAVPAWSPIKRRPARHGTAARLRGPPRPASRQP